jgi:hypothetical protein
VGPLFSKLEPRAKEWMALPGLEEEPDKDVIELF